MERLDLNGRTSGKMKVYCPLCRDKRKDKRDKSVLVNLDNGTAHCYYCDTTFYRRPTTLPPPPPTGTPPRAGGEFHADPSLRAKRSNPDSEVPWQSSPDCFGSKLPRNDAKTLIQKHADWFLKERAISRETLERMGVGSKEEWMPQTSKKKWCICFATMKKES